MLWFLIIQNFWGRILIFLFWIAPHLCSNFRRLTLMAFLDPLFTLNRSVLISFFLGRILVFLIGVAPHLCSNFHRLTLMALKAHYSRWTVVPWFSFFIIFWVEYWFFFFESPHTSAVIAADWPCWLDFWYYSSSSSWLNFYWIESPHTSAAFAADWPCWL